MKKLYEEPIILIEQYALTQNIAACTILVSATGVDCILNSALPDGYKNMAAAGYFNAGAQGCVESPAGMTEEDGTCYNQAANGAFGS